MSRRPPPPAARETLLAGRYRLVEQRPTTGAAMLWLGQDEALARPVAIRLLRSTDDAAEELLAAAAAAGRVTDPALTQVFDAAEQDGYAYVVREWATGRDLAALASRGPLEPERAVALTRTLAEAVRAAHEAGFAHLRLHPGNVFVADDDTVKVTDLATGAALHDLRAAATPASTRADTVGLGALLYAALTARWPHDELPAGGLSPAPHGKAGVCTPRQVRAGVPKALDTVTMRALAPASLGPRALPLTSPAALLRALAGVPATAPPGRTRLAAVREQPWVRRGVAIGGLVAVGAASWMAGLALGRVPGDGTDDFATEPGAQASGSPRRSAVLAIPQGGVSDFDPQGDRKENPDQVALAYDGDPSTAWQTAVYRGRPDLGGLKDGVGLRVDFGRPVAVSALVVRLLAEGVDLDLRVATGPPDELASYRTVGSVVKAERTATVAVQGGAATGRYWLVWLTRLPREGPGYAAGVAELRFTR